MKKANSRANLTLRFFVSRNRSLLVRAFTTYVRPLLEFNSPIWSPSLIRQINDIENIQRSYTKRLPGLKNCTYHQRLSILNLDSLELRRLNSDLILAYKIVFGHIITSNSNIIRIKNIPFSLRRHGYQLDTRSYNRTATRNSFLFRIINVWNNLPVDTNFQSISSFKNSVNPAYLTHFLKVNFT